AVALDAALAESLDFGKATIYGPAVGRPLEAVGWLGWRQSADQSCQGGCELLDMSPEGRRTLEEALATAAYAVAPRGATMVSSGALPDPSFLFAQALSGLTAAMFLFLIAAGLSLIFGVLRVLNFSHGSFYMLGAYLAYQVVQWAATTPGRFWWATIGPALGIAALGGVVERLLLRHLSAKE